MAEDGADPKDRPWSMNEWCWDPYNMLAMASDSKNMGAGSKPAAPFPFGAGSYTSQAHLAPAASLLLDEVNRNASRGRGPATCQVEGCSADLTTLKEYHQRYKICEFHLKVSSIIREGKRQRFCQQCGRFHDLTSFDGDKRSCRARLQRHNARRRKKTADNDVPSASKAPPVKRQPSLTRGSREFARTDSSKKQQTSDSASMDTKQESLGVRDESLETNSQQQPLRHSLGSAEAAGDGPARRQAHGGLGEESGSQLAARLNSSAFGTEQMQMPLTGGLSAELPSSINIPASFPPVEYGHDTSMDCLGDAGLFPPRPASSLPDYSDLNQAASQMQSTGFGTDQSGASTATAASLVDEARALLTYSGQYQAIEYTSEQHLTRMSAKLFKCTPEQLPGDLKANLLAMLQCGVNALEGYIRPGCLHLTLNAMVGTAMEGQLKALDVRGLFDHLVASSNKALWSSETLVLQWYDEAALVKDGRVLHVLSAVGSRGVLPQLQQVLPVALYTASPERLVLTGLNLAIVGNRVLARSQGQDVATEVLSSGFHEAEEVEEPQSYVEIRVPQKQRAGVLHVEVARGSLLSHSKPVLMLDSAAVAADVNHLHSLEHAGVDVDGLLLDLGKIVELKAAIAAAKFGSAVPVRAFGASDIADMAALARRQLRLAIDTAGVSLATFVLPVAVADAQSMAEAVESIDAVLDMPLLHRAVRSQSVPLVQMVLEWTSAVGINLLAGVPGPKGLTALHLAAVMEDGAGLAALLTGVCPDGAFAWTAAAFCGASPADVAFASGNRATHEHVLQQLRARLAAASADETESGDFEGGDDEFAVDPETGELLDPDDPLESIVEESPEPTVAPPTEDALQKLSAARKEQVSARASLADKPALADLKHQSSSMTNSSSIYTSSMSSTDTVLPRASNSTQSAPSLRKRHAAEAVAAVEYMPQDKGRASLGFYDHGCKADAHCFRDTASIKMAPTVFDGTYAAGSAMLIGACGGMTLLLRYCGNAFLD